MSPTRNSHRVFLARSDNWWGCPRIGNNGVSWGVCRLVAVFGDKFIQGVGCGGVLFKQDGKDEGFFIFFVYKNDKYVFVHGLYLLYKYGDVQVQQNII